MEKEESYILTFTFITKSFHRPCVGFLNQFFQNNQKVVYGAPGRRWHKMGRGYWLPPAYENLTAYDGFYIESSAVYTGDLEQDWNRFLQTLCTKLSYRNKTLTKNCSWKSCGAGRNRFVVLQNHHVDIIAEDVDEYIAVYVIIPEDCEYPGFSKRSFPQYVSLLEAVLIDMYPGCIRKRINSQRTKIIG